jgi:nickel-type superoxide dismutase maturation protease
VVRTEHYPVDRRAAAGRGVLAAGALVLAGWLASRVVRRVEVVGDSMAPTLLPGDRLVVLPALGGPHEGDLVALPDPRQPSRVVVKRVDSVWGGALSVVGDNPSASTDSRHFGPVAVDGVRGRAVYRYHPPDRRGSVARSSAPARAGRQPTVLWVSC